MAFQPVGNAAEVVIRAELDGAQCVNTLGFLGVVNWGAATLVSLVDLVASIWADSMIPLLPSTYEAFEVVGTGLRNASDYTHTFSWDGGISGELPGAQLPNNASLAIAFKTGLAGRSNRGRNFWPAFVEADVISNTVAQPRIESIVDAYETLRVGTAVGGNWLMAVLSRYSGGVERPTGVAIPITSISVTDATIDSMRRRLPGRGR